MVKGKSRYSKASVAYSFNGEARTQNIMSFANPDVFKKVQELVGQETEVTLVKNAAGYNEWSAIGDVGSSPASSEGPTPVGLAAAAVRVTGSNYETPAERAIKQVYIVKQSSISNAIAFCAATNADPTIQGVLDIAQQFVDYVFAAPVAE